MNVSRRTVLKTIGAALMAPTISLRSEIVRERLLQAFCDDASYRYDLTKPFGIGSLTYATDAKHMARAEIANRFEDGERRLPKGVLDAWKFHFQPGKFIPFELPSISGLTLTGNDDGICPLCDDRRISFGKTYPSEDEMDRLLDYDVDENTYRDNSCVLCHGLTYHGPCEAIVCGVRMSYSRLKPIAQLPNVRIARGRVSRDDYPFLTFVADGFEGVAMGLPK